MEPGCCRKTLMGVPRMVRSVRFLVTKHVSPRPRMSTGPRVTDPAAEDGAEDAERVEYLLLQGLPEYREVTDMPIPEVVEAAEVTNLKGAENGEGRHEVKEVSPPRYKTLFKYMIQVMLT